MRLFKVVLVVCLVLVLGYYLSPSSGTSSPEITPTENAAFRNIEPPVKVVAILPESLSLQIDNKISQIKTGKLGISITSALSLQVNYALLNKELDRLGIDSMRSSPGILMAVSRGASNIKVIAKPPATPAPVPAPVAPVPDYIPAPAPVPQSREYTYCVTSRGVDPSFLPELRTKLASVYSDSRGWSLGGVNTFTEVSSGCSLIVWLTAADQMPSFGSICDSTWSCTVYPNVILNFDRWRYASPAWNGGGGSLDDYRTMVINHETGHWLGFGHRFCSGTGQQAPVMQQQSINLQGCAANPWPLPYEKAAL